MRFRPRFLQIFYLYTFKFEKSKIFSPKKIFFRKFITSVENYNILFIKCIFKIFATFFFIELSNFETKSVSPSFSDLK